VKVERQRRDWDALAAADPLWAVLTDPTRRHGGWSSTEFFATGEAEIAAVLDGASKLGVPERFERALDFGCGAGRLTRALATRFDEAWGVDISPQMIDVARTLNADVPSCRFVVNVAPDLGQLESDSFDFVYSSLVLQHLPSREAVRAYLAEFFRVVRDDGVIIFQLPARIAWIHRLQPRRRLYALMRGLGVHEEFLLRRTPLTPMRMIAISEERVRDWIGAAGGTLLRTEPHGATGRRYYAKSSR
jgi:SAM-dependent methyltransferase